MSFFDSLRQKAPFLDKLADSFTPTLTRDEKLEFLQSLESICFPDGFAANISKGISKDGKLTGLKTHDYHILLKSITYYGILKNIYVLDYPNDRHVALFECEWYDLESNKPVSIASNTCIHFQQSFEARI